MGRQIGAVRFEQDHLPRQHTGEQRAAVEAGVTLQLNLDIHDELIIDNFAGGGGTSTGLEAAFGRPVDIAINHDPEALAKRQS